MYIKHCCILEKGDTKGGEIWILLTESSYLEENYKYVHGYNVSVQEMKETHYMGGCWR